MQPTVRARRLTRARRAVVGGVMLLPLLALAPPAGAAQPPLPVEVVNDDPVPVTVRNDASSPVPVAPAFPRTPWQRSEQIDFPDGQQNVFVNVFAVPAGLRLVIENVSTIGALPTDQHLIQFDIRTIAGGAAVQHSFLPAQVVGPTTVGGPNRHAASFRTRLYAEEETEVRILMVRSGTADLSGFTVSLSGYLIPAGSPSLAP